MGSRFRLWIAVAFALAALSAPMQERISAQSNTSGIMISEFRFSSTNFSSDEYIELFNSTSAPIDISGWWLKASDNRIVVTVADRVQVPANSVLGPGCYYLIASNNYSLSTTAVPDVRYPNTLVIPDDGSIAIFKADKTTIADQVGFRTAQNNFSAFFETERILQTPLPTPGRIYERKPHTFTGFQDTDNNVNDFMLKTVPGPQNKSASPCLQFLTYWPHDIQGSGLVSPLSGAVRVQGVVTARKADGFFIQTESGFEDLDPNTSEGVFVSAIGSLLEPAVVGHLVKVTGGVEEFTPATDPSSPSFTRVTNVVSVEDLGSRSVPDAYPLTSAELSDAGRLSQLERFEGMRVTVPSLTAVSGTDSDGAFFAVLTGQMRPFREPGVHAGYPVLPCAIAPCNVPVFDGNPERLRVDSDGLELHAPVLVSTGAVMTDVTGPLDFAARTYTLLPETLSPEGGMLIVAADAARADQFTVASLNLGVAHASRLAKASQAVRQVLNAPDVVGVQGVDTYGALSDLASQINSDAGAALYEATPSGNADDPLGVGVLLKVGRATALDQPEMIAAAGRSIALRVRVQGPSTSLPQDVTVVVSQLPSLTNVELNDATGAAVRSRRQAQAEALANDLQARQSSNPDEAIISLGDFNAFDFNDGYVDVVGTVRGVPAPPDQVALASPSLVNPPFVDADARNVDVERYASVANGNAQSLDHVLLSDSVTTQYGGLVHARVNADFPDALRDDVATPARFSDRDPLVAYFAFPADEDAPVFDAVQDAVAEATSAAGAVVTFETPQAHDNLDPVVNVNCEPLSGSAFALGNTAVTCSTTDAAGNASSVQFTVTVQDTTAPEISTSGDQLLEATSSNGAVANFFASATDAVTAPLTVLCTSLSGSTFPIGTTLVVCSTEDAAHNSASASFAVRVQDTTPPTLLLPANITEEATSSAGRIVTYVASAADLVTSILTVSCTPASESNFPIGDTVVACSTSDEAGNAAQGSFTVTITPPAANPLMGRMAGAGRVLVGQNDTWFAFDVRGGGTLATRGSVALMVREGSGRPARFAATGISDLVFSNSEGYEPGQFPRSGIDTVSFTGVGSWNGQSGYRFEISASDRGEPGRGLDTFSVKVYAPNGTVVESASGTLRDGNIQSLR